MFYKVLVLEIIVCLALVGWRFYPAPEGSALPGEGTMPARTSPAPKTKPYTRAHARKTDLALAPGQLVFPVAGHSAGDVISGFGDPRGKARRHQGIDVKAPLGTPVVAVTDGFIEKIREGGRGGKSVYLRDVRGRLFYYAHLDGWSVTEFEAVTAGQTIGTIGKTGNAEGTTPHLHFEVLLGKEREAVDPLPAF